VAKKEISIDFNLGEIHRETKKNNAGIMITFAYPPHLKVLRDQANDLVNKLMAQHAGGDIKIRQLCLTWDEKDD
jgi:hypothetical protein